MNGEDKKILNGLLTAQARMEEKIDNIHHDIKDIKQSNKVQQNDLIEIASDTRMNTGWIDRHQKEHDGYFTRVVAIIGVMAGIMTFGWKIVADIVFK